MKRTFTKLTAILLAVLTLFSLAACGNGEPGETTGPDEAVQTTSQTFITVGTTELRTVYMTRVPGFSGEEPPASDTGVIFGTTGGSSSESTEATSDEPAQTQATQTYPVPSQLALSVAPPSTDTLSFEDDTLDDFFSDAVFVGDSISLGWRNYVMSKRGSDPGFLGGAQFLVSGSLGAESALWDVNSESVHPSYQGTQMQLWNSIPLTGAKKVFIMFGLNDIGRYSELETCVDMAVSNYDELIGKIKANAPDVEIYIISATYVLEGGEKGKVTSANLRVLNEALIDYCRDNSIEFINFADALADANGNLAAEYCSDGYVHQTNAAYDVWTALLKGYAAGVLSGR
ncbi:MAG: hypothetical protein E7460_06505 [Ruminococcaceae bacterium]|nr:hypothetical protein [Oscillospiraceae bacterium]